MARILRAHSVNALNVSIRPSPADTTTLLSWAPTEAFSLVLYYKQRTSQPASAAVAVWTRELLEATLAHGRRYYLPYRLDATRDQFARAYPEARVFASLKARIDPANRFQNLLWQRHLSDARSGGALTYSPAFETIGALKPAPFDYHRPTSLAETFDLLERYGDDGRILAGGQSLVPTLNMRLATPRALIDINRLPGFAEIRPTSEGLVIGALARHDEIERSPVIRERAPLIAAAMPHVGHAAIRARGTFGGSLALADPAAELPACVVALDAMIRVASRRGTREIAAADFFQGVYTTALAPGEVIVEIVIPRAEPGWRDGFDELARRHGDFALAGLAARVRMDGRAARDARLVFFGVGNGPVRARQAEAALKAAGDVRAAQRALATELEPPGDIHGSPELRRHLAGVLLARVVGKLLERAS